MFEPRQGLFTHGDVLARALHQRQHQAAPRGGASSPAVRVSYAAIGRCTRKRSGSAGVRRARRGEPTSQPGDM